MPNLFGIDIAGVINDEITKAGGVRSGTLTKRAPGTRGADSTAGTNPGTSSHTFNGFVEMKSVRRQGQLSSEQMTVLTILGASVSPAAVPEVNDRATLDGSSFELLELISADPAAAVYEFRTE